MRCTLHPQLQEEMRWTVIKAFEKMDTTYWRSQRRE